MEALTILGRLTLAITFAVAAVAKLRDLQTFIDGLQGLGVPAPLQRASGLLLPWVELAIAVLLLWEPTAWGASVAALLLLLLFTGIIGYQLLRGRRPACNCFGQARAAPISHWTLARNAALAACALALVVSGPVPLPAPAAGPLGSPDSSGDTMFNVLLILVVLLAVCVFMLFQLIGQQGRLLLRVDNLEMRLDQRNHAGGLLQASNSAPQGLAVGSLAPAFSLSGLHGGLISLKALLEPGQPVVLVFSDPECGPCRTLLPRLVQWQRELAGRVTLVLVSSGDAQQNIRRFGNELPTQVLLQARREVADAYEVFATPSAVRINTAGLIDSPLAMADLAIDELVHAPEAGHEGAALSASMHAVAAVGRVDRHSMA